MTDVLIGVLTANEREALRAQIHLIGIEAVARAVGVGTQTIERGMHGCRVRPSTRDAIQRFLEEQTPPAKPEDRLVALSGNPTALLAITAVIRVLADAMGCGVEIAA